MKIKDLVEFQKNIKRMGVWDIHLEVPARFKGVPLSRSVEFKLT